MRVNAFFVTLTQIAIAIAPLIVMPHLARTLSAEGLGLYGFSYSIVSVFVIVAQFGTQLYGRREIARCQDDKWARSRVFWTLVFFLLRFFAVATILYASLVLFGPFSGQERTALLIQLGLLVFSAFDISWMFHGTEKFRILSYVTIFARLVMILGCLLLVRTGADSFVYILVMVVASGISFLFLWPFAFTLVGRPVRSDWRARSLGRQLVLFAVPSVAIQVSGVLGVLLLGWFSTLSEVGVFDLAFRLSRAPIAFITVLGVVLLPRATKLLSAREGGAGGELLKSGMAATMFVASGCCFGVIGISVTFVPLFAGPGFDQSARLLIVLCVSLLVLGWGNVLRTQIILPEGLDKVYGGSVVLGLLITAGLGLWWVGAFGSLGVALAFVVGEIAVAGFQSWSIRSRVQWRILGRIVLPYLSAGVMAAGAMMILLYTELSPPVLISLQAIVGGLLYVGLAVALERFSPQRFLSGELMRLRRVFTRDI